MPNIQKMIKKRDFDGIIQLLYHKNISMRIEAVNALGELKDIESIVKALKNDNPQVCIQAISELEKLDDDNAIQPIVDITIDEKNEDVWSSAFETTKRILSNSFGEDFWIQMALAAIKKNTIEHTLKILDRSLEINPDIETYIKIIATLHNNNFNKEALNYIEKTIEIEPSDVRLWMFKGDILAQFKQWDESETCIKKALEIDPKSEGAYHTLIQIYYISDQEEKFFSTIQKVIKYFPQIIRYRILFSEKLIEHGELERAYSEVQIALEKISEVDKETPDTLALLYQQAGIISVMKIDKDKALEYFLKAIEVDKESSWLYKLFDSYVLMVLLDEAEKGTPLKRRNLLLNRAEKRSYDVAYSTYLDYLEGGLDKVRDG